MIFNPVVYASDAFDVKTSSILPDVAVNNRIVVLTGTKPKTITFSYTTPFEPKIGDIWIQSLDRDGFVLSSSGSVSTSIVPGITTQYNGSLWEYREAYIGANNVWNKFSTIPSTDTFSAFNTLKWEHIIALANSGVDCSTLFNVGEEKILSLKNDAEGINEDITVAIGGFNLNTVANSGGKKASFALTFKDCLNGSYAMNSTNTNAGGWNGCLMRTSTMEKIFNSFPAELTKNGAVKEVYVYATSGGTSTSVIESVDKLRLHAFVELGTTHTYAKDGPNVVAYPYYQENTANRIKYRSGNSTAVAYWTRSVYTDNTADFYGISASGGSSSPTANTANAIACAFDI